VSVESDRVCLIVPCFNEAHRLDLRPFTEAASGGGVWFVFVDDGSTDGTAEMIRRQAGDRISVIRLERNVGKVKPSARASCRPRGCRSIRSSTGSGSGMADLSTPLDELPRFCRFPGFCAVRADAVIGSRLLRLGSSIRRRAIRHYVGRAFVTVASTLLDLRAYDSQCGAKLFTPAAAARAFAEPFVTRWLFDIEVLLRLEGATVLEYPVMQWTDVPGGKFRMLPTSGEPPATSSACGGRTRRADAPRRASGLLQRRHRLGHRVARRDLVPGAGDLSLLVDEECRADDPKYFLPYIDFSPRRRTPRPSRARCRRGAENPGRTCRRTSAARPACRD